MKLKRWSHGPLVKVDVPFGLYLTDTHSPSSLPAQVKLRLCNFLSIEHQCIFPGQSLCVAEVQYSTFCTGLCSNHLNLIYLLNKQENLMLFCKNINYIVLNMLFLSDAACITKHPDNFNVDGVK